MLNNDKIAAMVADQLKNDFSIQAEAAPYDENRARDGGVYFSMPVEQNHGIFAAIITSSYLKVSAGEVKDPSAKAVQVCVTVGLHYDHTHGGSNGSTIVTYWFEGDKLVHSRLG